MGKAEEMQKIEDQVKNCKKCSLYKTRNKPVTGAGSVDAKILFIGEAPGRNEDLQGYPFVGRAGSILDELLESIKLTRDDVFIANILKCRPPNNRNPMQSEIQSCTGYLNRQIDLIKPIIIAPLGNFACSFIFEKFNLEYDKISKVRGKVFDVNTLDGKIRIIPLYHPAVATYNPNTKTTLLDDFKSINNALEGG